MKKARRVTTEELKEVAEQFHNNFGLRMATSNATGKIVVLMMNHTTGEATLYCDGYTIDYTANEVKEEFTFNIHTDEVFNVLNQ